MSDLVNNPAHYTGHPSGVECIEVTRHLPFNRGNAFKYIFRHRDKGHPEQDLRKALWYIRDEIRTKGKIVSPNEDRRRAMLKILDETPMTWEAICYLCLCTPGIAVLRNAERALMDHLGEAST